MLSTRPETIQVSLVFVKGEKSKLKARGSDAALRAWFFTDGDGRIVPSDVRWRPVCRERWWPRRRRTRRL